jgi:peptidoglycan-N-acetylglucosamine deacetylase
LPHNSNQVLEILASQCVKATFFTIGRMARAAPDGVRKLRDAGHTIATHSQNHPLSMDRMAIERARQEIDQGIASVKAALGEDADKSLAPFFRIPGLLRADNVEDYLAKQGIQVWSADFLADDWHHISPSRVYDLAIRRLEAKRKGILLLHDIQPRTVAALPRILNEMKARGYRIVHVVPATSDLPATPTDQRQWRPHGLPDDMVVARWPDIPHFVFADLGQLPAPAFSDLDAPQAEAITHAQQQATWPSQFKLLPETAAPLPIPAQSLFELPIGLGAAVHHIAGSPRRMAANLRASDTNPLPARPRYSARLVQGRLRPGNGPASHPGRRPSGVEARANPGVAHPHRGRTNHLVQVKKRSA